MQSAEPTCTGSPQWLPVLAPLDKGSCHGFAVTEGINRELAAQLTEGIKSFTRSLLQSPFPVKDIEIKKKSLTISIFMAIIGKPIWP